MKSGDLSGVWGTTLEPIRALLCSENTNRAERSLEDTRLLPKAAGTLRDFPAPLPTHTSGEAR